MLTTTISSAMALWLSSDNHAHKSYTTLIRSISIKGRIIFSPMSLAFREACMPQVILKERHDVSSLLEFLAVQITLGEEGTPCHKECMKQILTTCASKDHCSTIAGKESTGSSQRLCSGCVD